MLLTYLDCFFENRSIINAGSNQVHHDCVLAFADAPYVKLMDRLDRVDELEVPTDFFSVEFFLSRPSGTPSKMYLIAAEKIGLVMSSTTYENNMVHTESKKRT